jgi:hypothetical protein
MAVAALFRSPCRVVLKPPWQLVVGMLAKLPVADLGLGRLAPYRHLACGDRFEAVRARRAAR